VPTRTPASGAVARYDGFVAKFITYLTWTEDGVLRQTVYVGLRSDKPAAEVRRELPRKG
jgi:ATP-dependent DNA ligase